MNLDNNPTMDELRDLLRPLDDRAAHHVLWVDRTGEVHITPMEKTWPAPKKPGPDVLDNALVYFERSTVAIQRVDGRGARAGAQIAHHQAQ